MFTNELPRLGLQDGSTGRSQLAPARLFRSSFRRRWFRSPSLGRRCLLTASLPVTSTGLGASASAGACGMQSSSSGSPQLSEYASTPLAGLYSAASLRHDTASPPANPCGWAGVCSSALRQPTLAAAGMSGSAAPGPGVRSLLTSGDEAISVGAGVPPSVLLRDAQPHS